MITVYDRGDGYGDGRYMACINDDKKLWDCSWNRGLAVGQVIKTHPEMVQVSKSHAFKTSAIELSFEYQGEVLYL